MIEKLVLRQYLILNTCTRKIKYFLFFFITKQIPKLCKETIDGSFQLSRMTMRVNINAKFSITLNFSKINPREILFSQPKRFLNQTSDVTCCVVKLSNTLRIINSQRRRIIFSIFFSLRQKFYRCRKLFLDFSLKFTLTDKSRGLLVV